MKNTRPFSTSPWQKCMNQRGKLDSKEQSFYSTGFLIRPLEQVTSPDKKWKKVVHCRVENRTCPPGSHGKILATTLPSLDQKRFSVEHKLKYQNVQGVLSVHFFSYNKICPLKSFLKDHDGFTPSIKRLSILYLN